MTTFNKTPAIIEIIRKLEELLLRIARVEKAQQIKRLIAVIEMHKK